MQVSAPPHGIWSKESQEWSRRSLSGKHYVYLWVDGVHFNVRLGDDRQCILVVMGATKDGKEELVAIAPGDPHRIRTADAGPPFPDQQPPIHPLDPIPHNKHTPATRR
ncbi:MAG: transposase [Planctomycetes bacterium]|nr:transposase [Planctomycetota bacterium]